MTTAPTPVRDGHAGLLEAVIEAFPDGLVLITASGVVLRGNQQAAELLGVPLAALTGRSVDELAPPLSIEMKHIRHVAATRQTASWTQDLPDGRKLLVSARPVSTSAAEAGPVLMVLRNVTGMNALLSRVHGTGPALRTRWVDGRGAHAETGDAVRLIAGSQAMRAVQERALQCAAAESPVLILGETGTGKNLLARLIHQASPRKAGPLREVNFGALPETLIEAELFGYVRGAFTGADVRGKPGLVELANGGTLLLDEIGDLPGPLQVKLLRFLEAGEIWPIGATRPRQPDVRILAATNAPLEGMVEAGTFRRDLFYRLNVLVITIPPLRDHPEDIPALVDMMLATLEQRLGRRRRLSTQASDIVQRYAFPGNVRELWNIVERIVITSTREQVEIEDLPAELLCSAPPAPAPRSPARLDFGSLRESLKRFEASILRDALARHGTQSRAAKYLGVGQATIARKAKQYGLGDSSRQPIPRRVSSSE